MGALLPALDTEAINPWLAAVRLGAALLQPTASRLAQVLVAQRSHPRSR